MFNKLFFSLLIINTLLLSFTKGQETCNIFSNDKVIYKGKEPKAFLDSLNHIGYYTLSAKKTEDRKCSYTINKGKQYKNFIIEGEKLNSYKTLKYDSKKNIFLTTNFEKHLQYIKDSLNKNGELFSKINIQPKGYKNGLAIIEILIEKEKKRTIDNIKFIGYNNFPPHIKKDLLNKFKFANQTNIKLIENELSRLNFTKTTSSPKLSFTKDSTTLFIYTKKLNQSYFNGLIGFGNNEENKLKVEGNIEINLKNVFNRLENINLNWQSGPNKSQQLETKTIFPSLFKSKLGFSSNLSLRKQDSTYIRTEWNNGLSYNISQDHYISGTFNLASSSYIETENEPNKDFNKSGFGINYQFSNSNNTILKENKTHLSLSTILWKLKNQNKTTNQTELSYIISRQQRILKNHFLFLSIKGENLIQESNNLANDSYLIGGFNSIRGFNQNSIPTNAYNSLNIAYRFIPNNKIYFELFNDNTSTKYLSKKNTFHALGIGTSLKTRFGFFSINYATSLQKNTSFSFSNSKIHIGLKNLF